MKYFFGKLILAFYLGLFCFFIHLSINKYMKGTTKFETNFVESKELLYPSVSVCPKYTFKSPTVNRAIFKENKSLEEQKMFVMGKIWKKDEVFHFVNHPGIFGLSFPCVTLIDGTDPGKPCHFPLR